MRCELIEKCLPKDETAPKVEPWILASCRTLKEHEHMIATEQLIDRDSSSKVRVIEADF